MKLIIETTGNFQLMLPKDELAHYDRPSVVSPSGFLDSRISVGQVKVLAGNLPDMANDSDFVAYYKDSGRDADLAVSAYVSSFEEPEKCTTSRRTRK